MDKGHCCHSCTTKSQHLPSTSFHVASGSVVTPSEVRRGMSSNEAHLPYQQQESSFFARDRSVLTPNQVNSRPPETAVQRNCIVAALCDCISESQDNFCADCTTTASSSARKIETLPLTVKIGRAGLAHCPSTFTLWHILDTLLRTCSQPPIREGVAGFASVPVSLSAGGCKEMPLARRSSGMSLAEMPPASASSALYAPQNLKKRSMLNLPLICISTKNTTMIPKRAKAHPEAGPFLGGCAPDAPDPPSRSSG